MIINDETIKKLATLSRLELTQEEMEKLKTNIPNILAQFDKLSKINTDGIEPISQVTGLKNIKRKDETIPFSNSKELTSCAPSVSDNGSFLVKNVL